MVNKSVSVGMGFRNVGRAAQGLLVASCFIFGTSASAKISFSFNFNGAAGDAFSDPTNGAARRQAVVNAGNLYSNMFATHFSNSTNISIDVTGLDDSASNVLMSAGTRIRNISGFGNGELIYQKLVSNGAVSIDGSSHGGGLNVNFGHNFELNPSVTPGARGSANPSYDFYGTFDHEMTHAIGFGDAATLSGADLFGKGQTTPGAYSRFDKFLVDKNGNSLFDHSTSMVNQSIYDAAIQGPNRGVFFDGLATRAANGGTAAAMFTPYAYQEGSSVSHPDDTLFPGDLMAWSRDYGDNNRDYSALDVGILSDLGYTSTMPVPEPQTYALMVLGLGAIGWANRRRKN